MAETIKNRKIAEEKIIELNKQKEKYISDLQKLNTEKGIEENIREKFGLAKPGEGMIVIVDDKNSTGTQAEEKTNGFYSFLKNLFK